MHTPTNEAGKEWGDTSPHQTPMDGEGAASQREDDALGSPTTGEGVEALEGAFPGETEAVEISPDELYGLAVVASSSPMVDVTRWDRVEFGRALVIQGYSLERAAFMANDIEANDGAIQMLARHRVRYENGPQFAAPDLVEQHRRLREAFDVMHGELAWMHDAGRELDKALGGQSPLWGQSLGGIATALIRAAYPNLAEVIRAAKPSPTCAADES